MVEWGISFKVSLIITQHMKTIRFIFFILLFLNSATYTIQSQSLPNEIKFVRQGAKRLIFDKDQSIPLASINPETIVGLEVMHPITSYLDEQSNVFINKDKLVVESKNLTQTGVWIGGFNPFSTYSIDLASVRGEGEVGFEFSDEYKEKQLFITVQFKDSLITDVKLKVFDNKRIIADESISINLNDEKYIKSKIILQMLGSGLVLYSQGEGLPKVIGQSDFNHYLDLREKQYIQSFNSSLFVNIMGGRVEINNVDMSLSTGVGLADIRAITYENGEPLLDQGRLWYTMSIRGRALPHHIQGVFSMNPTLFDVKLEGIVVFDRDDGLLRNEIASHIFYDRNLDLWRGITTGFSAYANIDKEKKQLLTIESEKDPRFGFSIMTAQSFGVVGDIEDPHVLYDTDEKKWRMLTCINQDGYKAIMMESDFWNKDYRIIAGPVKQNSTGTSIQSIGDKRYCFSGSSERDIFIYTYPNLKEAGTLKMDLPPWNEKSGTRVWPNVVQLPDGYPFKYVALMMDRFNYPSMHGPNWTYGALYLYHGYD